MRWLFYYLVDFYFISFLLRVEELSFCFQFFPFNCNFDFFYHWWQIIKWNAVFFTKNLRCGQVMMNEWLIISGLKQKAYRNIYFYGLENKPLRHLFCSSFKVIHDLIKCWSVFVRTTSLQHFLLCFQGI